MRLTKIKNITKVGKRKTIDLEVNHKDHNFYCNNIVVSNSHSISYANLAASTVYMKFKHPLEFFISLLKMSVNEQDPHKLIDAINKELTHFNIKLLPPDLIKSSMDFSVDGNNIRYGLNAIKNVSGKSLESIVKFRNAETSNKFDIFMSAKEAKINIGVLCSLIQAGALNSIRDNRAYMVYEAQVFNILTDREKRNWINFGPKYDYDVFKIWEGEVNGANIGDDGKVLVSDRRKETIQEKCKKFTEIYNKNKKNKEFANWYFEKKLLGYSYDKRLKDVYSTNQMLCGIEDILKLEYKKKGLTVGVIDDIYNGKTRNGDKKYCRLTLSDEVEQVTCFIWEEKLEEMQESGVSIEKEAIVSVYLEKMNGNAASVVKISNLKDTIYMKLSDLK